MATITGLTAARMLEVEASSIVSGEVVDDNLILTTRGGTDLDAGEVRGPQGDVGPAATLTYLTDEDDDVYAPGTANVDITYPHVSLTLTAGTWLVHGQAAIENSSVDAIALAIFDTTPTKRIQGPTNTVSLAGSAVECTACGIIVVASSMTINLRAQRNGNTTLKIGNTTAMNPAQRLTAVKIA